MFLNCLRSHLGRSIFYAIHPKGCSLKYKSLRNLNSYTLRKLQDCLAGTGVSITGWVRSIRKHGKITFLHVEDGTTARPLQVLLNTSEIPGNLSYGCSVSVIGKLQESTHAKQKHEVHADQVIVVGACDAAEFPFKARQNHSMEYTRRFPHLRARSSSAAAMYRLRAAAARQFIHVLESDDFVQVHTPILTSNDCEGAGEVFRVQEASNVGKITSDDEDFFKKPTYLTVSGQLHLEAMLGGFSRVFTLGPVFRADPSTTPYHLAEFYMLEAEIAFLSNIQLMCDMIEQLIKETTRRLLDQHAEDISALRRTSDANADLIDASLLCPSYQRLTYTEAVSILEKLDLKNPVKWGDDLSKEHEKALIEHHGFVPVFVTDFPTKLKAFYVRPNDTDPNTCASMDLLVPGCGEMVGGTVREERLDVLEEKLSNQDVQGALQWYLELRRYGTCPHAGYGLGFERYLKALTGINNLRDTIPFPRHMGSCYL